MENCIFCKIAKQEIPTQIIYEDDEIVAFPDINPDAPVHILILPKRHIESLNQLEVSDIPLVGKMILIAKQIAEEKGIAESGYRIRINTGPDAGQIINHLHLHLVGGKKLS